MATEYEISGTHITGRIGVHGVNLALAKIGWGVEENSTEDVGSGVDLLLLARDTGSRGPREYGGFATGQVKSGPSAFSEVTPNGWIYRDDLDVLDRWTGRAIPHFLFLYDADADRAYWVHVTRQAAEITGVQFKIEVPRAQLIDEAARSSLNAIVRNSLPPIVAAEGSAWNPSGLAHLDEPQRWAAALLTSRLIAPHQNLGFEHPIDASQALALVMSGRCSDWDRFHDRHPAVVPSVADTRGHEDESWRFAGAIANAIEGEMAPVEGCAHDFATFPLGALSRIFVAASATLAGEVDQALELLDGASPLSAEQAFFGAWIDAHRARALLDIGQKEEARACSDRARVILDGLSEPWTKVVRAGVASTELRLAEITEIDIARWVSATDVAAIWWSSHARMTLEAELVQEAFEAWTHTKVHRVGFRDFALEELEAAMWAACLAADHGRCVALSSELAKTQLVRLQDPPSVRAGLEGLRRSGDNRSLVAAARHLRDRGPIEPLVWVTRRLTEPSAWTRTSAQTNLQLLSIAGPVLDTELASEMTLLCLDALRGGDRAQPLTRLGPPAFLGWYEAARGLSGVAAAADRATAGQVADWLIDTVGKPMHQLILNTAGDIFTSLPNDAIDPHREALIDWSRHAHGETTPLARAFLKRFAQEGDANALALIDDQARHGDVDAVGTLASLGERIPTAAFQPLIARVRADVASAEAGVHSMGAVDAPALLTIAALQDADDLALWNALTDFLVSARTDQSSKSNALEILARSADRIPSDVRDKLIGSIDAIGAGTAFFDDPAPAILVTIGFRRGVGLGGTNDALVRLALAPQGPGRTAAAEVLATFGDHSNEREVGLLIGLSGDPDPAVRDAATTGAVRWLTHLPDDATLGLVARLAAASEGLDPARAVLRAIPREPTDRRPIHRELLDLLSMHPYAGVRKVAVELLS
jgi:hypothetical protein